jgi:catechol 2,3-dioxygenase-like lactoylglutathione lyase family enzyme
MTATPLIGIAHPVVITRDLDRALAFYRDLLGFMARPITTHDPQQIARLGGPPNIAAQAVILHAPDGSELEIACFTKPNGDAESRAGWADAGIRSITFKVSNMAVMLDRLGTAGYGLVNEVVEFVVKGKPVEVAYVRGPDGVILTLLYEGGQ